MATMMMRTARLFGAFLRWWMNELAGMIPDRIRRLLTLGGGQTVVDIEGGAVAVGARWSGKERRLGSEDARDAAAIRRLLGGRRRAPVVLRLRPPQVLHRTIELPLAAEENLREVLHFEMDRHTPFAGGDVCFGHRIVHRDEEARSLTVDLAVVPRRVLDEVLAQAAAWGVRPQRVESLDGVTVMLPQAAMRGRRMGTYANAALAAAALVLAVVAVHQPLAERAETLAALQDRVAAAREKAEAVAALRDELETLRGHESFLFQRKAAAPLAVAAIDELSRLLPDDTWIFHLQMEGGEVQISGYSAASSQLVRIVEDSEMFTRAHFRSPVTQDPNLGLERFNLSARTEDQP